ncbi:MAG: Fic family protein [Methanoregula sp.]|nr:Fic family protein [Methanoregula sp.]
MKLPKVPQFSDTEINAAISLARDPKILESALQYNDRYLHWEELRHHPLPADAKSVWILMKFLRRTQSKQIPFDGWRFPYTLNDSCWQMLHHFDKTAAGNLTSVLDTIGHDRERYIVNSLMEEAIASSQLEGAATTRTIAKQMLRERRKPTNRDERMIVNNYLTMKKIREIEKEDLTPALVLSLHKMITNRTLEDPADEGRFRNNDDIRVVDSSGTILHTPPASSNVPELIDELCRFANDDKDPFIHPVIKGIFLHFLVGYIHPFNDGNGRTARTLFYWYVLRHDYWLFEYMAISRAIKDTKGQYKKAYVYTESDENDLTYFIQYNLTVIETTITEIRKYIGEQQAEQIKALHSIEESEGLSYRQIDILKRIVKHPEKPLRIKEIEETYHVAYATARSDLIRLEELGYLKRRTLGKEYVFLFRELPKKSNAEDS